MGLDPDRYNAVLMSSVFKSKMASAEDNFSMSHLMLFEIVKLNLNISVRNIQNKNYKHNTGQTRKAICNN